MDGKLAEQAEQRMVISGTKSTRRTVAGAVPQGSILDPVLSNNFINDMDDRTEYILNKAADDTKVGGVTGMSVGCAAIEQDLDRVKEWADRNPMPLTQEKCSVLQWHKKQPHAPAKAECCPAGKQLCKKWIGGH